MERWQNRVAVVTGASSGIGAAVCTDLVKAGLVCVGLARRKERLDEVRACLPSKLQQRLHVLKCDVSDLCCVTEAFDWIEQKLGGIDILVNCAGTLTPGQLLTQNPTVLHNVLQTNVMGVTHCTQRAFKSMKARNFDGHVLILNGVLGHKDICPPPGELPILNIYTATKHALTAITETLRNEFRGFNTKIKVTAISPGTCDTEIVPDKYRTGCMLKPEDISACILYCIGTPQHVQVHELTIRPICETY